MPKKKSAKKRWKAQPLQSAKKAARPAILIFASRPKPGKVRNRKQDSGGSTFVGRDEMLRDFNGIAPESILEDMG